MRKRILVLLLVISICISFCGCKFSKVKIANIDKLNVDYYLDNASKISGRSVIDGDVTLEGFTNENILSSELINISNQSVIEGNGVFNKIYPASTTKIMTAYLAYKYGNLDDYVTISANATNIGEDSTSALLKEGDKVKLSDLIYGLLLPSGNDAAIAIAENISGSVPEFAKLMNETAKSVGATHTNFVNANGLHDPNHYTTAYDLYLIFNEAIKDGRFKETVETPSYLVNIYDKEGKMREVVWNNTNRFLSGQARLPENVTCVGGKTGTTDEAGACLVLYAKGANEKEYISVVMGSQNHDVLYDKMSFLLSNGIK